MNAEYRRKRTLELIDLVLLHDPNAPIGLLTDVISDWSDLFDGEQLGALTRVVQSCAAAIGLRFEIGQLSSTPGVQRCRAGRREAMNQQHPINSVHE